MSSAGKTLRKTGRIEREFIRNFSIIAHIDHGKSTLADQLLLKTGAITQREFKDQILDDLDIERDRGITVKAHAVAIRHERDGQVYELNLIDTPGHVDFAYEVSRSLAACEGALLLVDAFQGAQAQTVANAYAAIESNLEIIPVVNKIDLDVTRIDEVLEEIETVIGLDSSGALKVSAKTGLNIDTVFDAIIDRIPAPAGSPADPLRALIFDSKYDSFRGVIIYIRLVEGEIKKGDKIRFMRTGGVQEVIELGQFTPKMVSCDELGAGQVGYIITGVKQLEDIKVGDTVTLEGRKASEPLPGYREPQQMVFCGMYPIEATDFEKLRDELSRMALNDASFSFAPETSDALGFGFRCGFLGMLHMEIIQQRLESESNIDLIQTAPNVTYELLMRGGEVRRLDNPQEVPDAGSIEEFREPIARVNFIVPTTNIGVLMQMCEDRRGNYINTEFLGPDRAQVIYELPLAEIIYDMHDRLKSATRGYGTMDYEVTGYRDADLVKMDILVKSVRVDALATIVHRSVSEKRGRALVKRLKDEISKHQFEIPLQAAIGGRIIARETISALKKNVTAKCYGGDITRKRKLWAKQKEGKKRLKQFGQVEIPQKAFLSVLEAGKDD
ncbi:elongation factor 4 [bacterium]|uniref:Elongation factor 4 n=1 Tax=Rubinisphaera brasiliensis (strain ATCC 49424 / DSM 5305 / JCM 21570 / IAM 15109 / NBRC 103401 / IFAM 1448) TaxID=756272 RepID=F0SF54_RUBBR|nr:translation elongation factor 4 [Rubinisphaera brasiliensis]ADY58209.1 GTP-binding protein LepA [Rubinisphaera brasiliensis DSM 5305]MBR9800347.1 elongation factor 4 [bacterium]